MSNRRRITDHHDRDSLTVLLSQCTSPVQCAERLGVTSQSVYELIKRWDIDITSIYGDTKTNKFKQQEVCDEVESCLRSGATLTDISKQFDIHMSYLTAAKKQEMGILGLAIKRGLEYHEEQMALREAYEAEQIKKMMSEGKSFQTISRELSLPNTRISALRKKFNIDTKEPVPTREELETKLASNTTKQVAEHYNVTVNKLRKWCKDLDVVLPRNAISTSIKTISEDKNKFAEQAALFKTQNDMAHHFGCHVSTINMLAIKHGLRQLSVEERCPVLNDRDQLLKLYETYSIQDIADILGCSHPKVRDKLREYGADTSRQTTSKIELRLFNIIQSMCPDAVLQDRVELYPQEIDIYIPSKKIGIEVNGLYWHSNKFKDINYHKDKKQRAAAVGIRIIHIFEDELENKWDVVIRKLTRLLTPVKTVYARQCLVSNVLDKSLFEYYHIQGYRPHTYCVSLEHKGKVVASGLFLKNQDKVELIRYASSECVVGGMSRVIKAFIRQYGSDYTSLYTYADLTWCDFVNSYDVIGMKREHITPPDYYYYKTYDGNTRRFGRQHRRNFTREKIKTRFPEIYRVSHTEWQMMDEAGYVRIYDCGKIKYSIDLHGVFNEKGYDPKL